MNIRQFDKGVNGNISPEFTEYEVKRIIFKNKYYSSWFSC